MSDSKDHINSSAADILIEQLLSGHDLYVKKNDYTPSKINARQGKDFTRNASINGQHTDLCWLSSKGFRLGIIFTGAGFNSDDCAVVPKTREQVYIARFNIDRVTELITGSGSESYSETIRELLSGPNDFAEWHFWPQYPADTYEQQSNADPSEEQEIQYLNTAYEQWFQQYDVSTSYEPETPVNAIYRGSQRMKTTGEPIYRFSVTINGKSDNYHLVEYESEFYLLDYVYDSVSLNEPMREEILAVCKKKLPRI